MEAVIAGILVMIVCYAGLIRLEHKRSDEQRAQLMVELEKLNAQLATIKEAVREIEKNTKFLG